MSGVAQVFQIPELKKRLMFTISMLAVYRFGIFVSTPGVNVDAIRQGVEQSSNTIFGLINLFSGGALEEFSIFVLGISPYITMSIIIQLLTPSIPFLENLKKEGDAGRRILTRYTRRGTILLAILQSYMIAKALEAKGAALVPGLHFEIVTVITLTAGTAFIMWLGEQITERGLGNGTSIIIFAGIAARMPAVFGSTVELARTGELSPIAVLALLFFSLFTIYAIIFVERSNRKIPVQYPRRMVGNRSTMAQTQYMPLKVNMSGVIPPIFSSAIMMLPATLMTVIPSLSMSSFAQFFTPGAWGYEAVYVALIILFSFFYTAVVFNPVEVAENLKKNGGFIPLVRPGAETADYLYGVLNRLTLWGAIYIAAVCVVPQVVYLEMGAAQFAYVFGGTAVLIVVGVTLDTASQIESMLVARNYEAFMSKSSKVKGGIGSASYQRNRLARK
jgi:preprotein translocase subunit SecY